MALLLMAIQRAVLEELKVASLQDNNKIHRKLCELGPGYIPDIPFVQKAFGLIFRYRGILKLFGQKKDRY
jgi:hypothetical protein